MGHAANKAKERTCKDCKQSIFGNAADIQDHASTCARLTKLNLVVPGLLVGQAAYDELRRVDPRRRRM